MTSPTDAQVEAAISVIDFALEARGLKNAISANAYPSADGGADIDNGALPQIEIMLRDIAERVAAKALTAAFSLAPAGTVEVSEDDKAAIREYATRGSPYRHATLAHSNFVVCVERIALAWIEEQRSSLLPPQPSADLPGVKALAEGIELFDRGFIGRAHDKFTAALAALVSQPHLEGDKRAREVVADYYRSGGNESMAADVLSDDWLAGASESEVALVGAIAKAFHPAPHKAGDEGLIEAAETLRFNAANLIAEEELSDALRTLDVAREVMRDVANRLEAEITK